MPEEFDFHAMQAQGNTAGVPNLYVLTMTPLPLTPDSDTASGDPTPLGVHYAYSDRLVRQGKILAIGPCMGEPRTPGYAPVPPGLGILNVATLEEAEEIARDEPFHVMGWRHNTVTTWTPKFGDLIEVLRDTATGNR